MIGDLLNVLEVAVPLPVGESTFPNLRGKFGEWVGYADSIGTPDDQEGRAGSHCLFGITYFMPNKIMVNFSE